VPVMPTPQKMARCAEELCICATKVALCGVPYNPRYKLQSLSGGQLWSIVSFHEIYPTMTAAVISPTTYGAQLRHFSLVTWKSLFLECGFHLEL